MRSAAVFPGHIWNVGLCRLGIEIPLFQVTCAGEIKSGRLGELFQCLQSLKDGDGITMVAEAHQSTDGGFRLAIYRRVGEMDGFAFIYAETSEVLAALFIRTSQSVSRDSRRLWTVPFGLGSGKTVQVVGVVEIL